MSVFVRGFGVPGSACVNAASCHDRVYHAVHCIDCHLLSRFVEVSLWVDAQECGSASGTGKEFLLLLPQVLEKRARDLGFGCSGLSWFLSWCFSLFLRWVFLFGGLSFAAFDF